MKHDPQPQLAGCLSAILLSFVGSNVGLYVGAYVGAVFGDHEHWDDIVGGSLGFLLGMFSGLVYLCCREIRILISRPVNVEDGDRRGVSPTCPE